MQFSPFPCHPAPFRPGCSPQHPIPEHPWPMFLLQCAVHKGISNYDVTYNIRYCKSLWLRVRISRQLLPDFVDTRPAVWALRFSSVKTAHNYVKPKHVAFVSLFVCWGPRKRVYCSLQAYCTDPRCVHCSHFHLLEAPRHNDAGDPSSERWNKLVEKCPVIWPKVASSTLL
jgi:hypothetical protein